MTRRVALLAGYVGVVVGFTWPLAARITTHVSAPQAPMDAFYSAWTLGWQSHALATSPWSIADANIYHPTPRALFYGPLAQGALPLFAPVFLLGGNPTLALNVVLIGGLALLGWSMHEVVRGWTGSWWAGLAAGGVLLTNGWLVWGFVPSAPHWAMLGYLPWIMLRVARPGASGRAVALLAALVLLQCLTDLVYLAPGVLILLAVVAGIRLVRVSSRRDGIRLLLVLGLVLLALTPPLSAFVRVRAENPALLEQTNWKSDWIALSRRMAESLAPGQHDQRRALYDGPLEGIHGFVWALVGAGVLGALVNRVRHAPGAPDDMWAHGLLWVLVGVILSRPWLGIGPARIPQRLGMPGAIGIAALAGCAVVEANALLARLRPAWARGLVCGGLAASVWWAGYAGRIAPLLRGGGYPLQQTPTIPAPIVEALSRLPGPLLVLPLGDSPVAPYGHVDAMYLSLAHWHPLLNGYASYWPAAFPARMQLAARLPAPDALAELVGSTNLRLVWVRLGALQAPARQRWQPPGGTSPPGFHSLVRTPSDLLLEVVPAVTAAPR